MDDPYNAITEQLRGIQAAQQDQARREEETGQRLIQYVTTRLDRIDGVQKRIEGRQRDILDQQQQILSRRETMLEVAGLAYLHGQQEGPAAAEPPSGLRRLGRWVFRWPWRARVCAMSAAAAIAALLAWQFLDNSMEPAKRFAVQPTPPAVTTAPPRPAVPEPLPTTTFKVVEGQPTSEAADPAPVPSYGSDPTAQSSASQPPAQPGAQPGDDPTVEPGGHECERRLLALRKTQVCRNPG